MRAPGHQILAQKCQRRGSGGGQEEEEEATCKEGVRENASCQVNSRAKTGVYSLSYS